MDWDYGSQGMREEDREEEKERREHRGNQESSAKMARGIKLGGKEAHPWEGEVLGSRMGEENWAGGGARVLSETGPGI